MRSDGGLQHGFQLWVNLPAVEKMTPPRYQEFLASEIPEVTLDGVTVRVIAGRFADVVGPVETHSPVTYLHVRLASGATVTVPAVEETALVYTFAGDGEATMRVYGDGGDTVTLTNEGSDESQHLVLTGQPLREPIARYGPFVMNTADEIEQAMSDYQSGRFGLIVRDSGP
jgi:quercetin 2,3-dioxygenase